jgi:hypothetical protein
MALDRSFAQLAGRSRVDGSDTGPFEFQMNAT